MSVEFVIAQADCQTVLGLSTYQDLGLVKRIFNVSQKHLLKEYADVFSGLGCLPVTIHINFDPNVMPVIDPPRKVPFALYQRLKDELCRMEKLKVIAKVNELSEWVSH